MATKRPKKAQAQPLNDVLADRIRAQHERLKWTQDDLAERMTLLGFNWNRVTVAESEGKGRGRRVTVDELVALAMVFGVGVVILLTPDASGAQITDKLTLTPVELREAVTVGFGEAGPPELRRMQLEFRRQQARLDLERSVGAANEADTRIQVAQKDLEELEAQLSELPTEPEDQ